MIPADSWQTIKRRPQFIKVEAFTLEERDITLKNALKTWRKELWTKIWNG